MHIAGYTYRAEQLCPNCTIEELKRHNLAAPYDHGDDDTIKAIADKIGIDYFDQYSYDSDDFPKPFLNVDCGAPVSEYDFDHERCNGCGKRLCEI